MGMTFNPKVARFAHIDFGDLTVAALAPPIKLILQTVNMQGISGV